MEVDVGVRTGKQELVPVLLVGKAGVWIASRHSLSLGGLFPFQWQWQVKKKKKFPSQAGLVPLKENRRNWQRPKPEKTQRLTLLLQGPVRKTK